MKSKRILGTVMAVCLLLGQASIVNAANVDEGSSRFKMREASSTLSEMKSEIEEEDVKYTFS
ncbi:MAG: hypothetical protein ACRC7V_03480 [Lachnospiraceae bacterium]